MICAAGIGVTPLAASMKSILNYRWRYHTGKTFPDQVDCYWVCSYRDLKMFRWFVRTIRECEDTINDITYKNPESIMNKYFQFHLFVTSFKEGTETEDTSNLRVRFSFLPFVLLFILLWCSSFVRRILLSFFSSLLSFLPLLPDEFIYSLSFSHHSQLAPSLSPLLSSPLSPLSRSTTSPTGDSPGRRTRRSTRTRCTPRWTSTAQW